MPDGSWFLTRYADLVAVSRAAQAFSSEKKVDSPQKSGPGSPLLEHHPPSLVFNDPPLHTRVRRLIMGALTRRAIADMEPGLILLVETLMDGIEQKGGGDLIEDFASAIPVEIIGNLLDVPHADRGPLRAWSLAILGALEPKLTPEQEALGNRSVREFTDYLRLLVAERRRRPGDPEHDVLTRLIQGEEAGERLGESELLQNCVFILNAGHETTTNLIGNALVALQEWPGEKERLLARIGPRPDWAALEPVMTLAVDEFLRFESSNQLGNRRALRACEVGGVALPAGALVTLCIGAANRDPEAFPEPERFDIARSPNPHLAFGAGAHACAGMSVARLEAQVALSRLAQRMPEMQLLPGAERSTRARFRGFRRLPATTH